MWFRVFSNLVFSFRVLDHRVRVVGAMVVATMVMLGPGKGRPHRQKE
jgi:hypothetical protein